jgi:hypothetical protein
MKVVEEAKVSRLATDMILVAVRDLKTPETCLEAALWFVGRDFGFWAEAAGVSYLDPLSIFRSLKKRHARVLLARIRRVWKGYEALPPGSGYAWRDVLRLENKVSSILEGIAGHTSTDRKYLYKKEVIHANKFIPSK